MLPLTLTKASFNRSKEGHDAVGARPLGLLRSVLESASRSLGSAWAKATACSLVKAVGPIPLTPCHPPCSLDSKISIEVCTLPHQDHSTRVANLHMKKIRSNSLRCHVRLTTHMVTEVARMASSKCQLECASTCEARMTGHAP